MDENLLKTSREKPFYITEESKKVLTDAIQNDTAFLEANSMMDYSLFVAIDGAELVLGSVSKLVALTNSLEPVCFHDFSAITSKYLPNF